MYLSKYRHLSLFLFSCCLIALLAACGSGGSTATGAGQTATTGAGNPGKTPTAGPAGSSNPGGSTPTTVTVQTSCPSAGTARAAVMPSLTLGRQQNVVYI